MIRIATDSTCDLPAALLEEYGISVIPLGVVKGERLYRDGVDISTGAAAEPLPPPTPSTRRTMRRCSGI